MALAKNAAAMANPASPPAIKVEIDFIVFPITGSFSRCATTFPKFPNSFLRELFCFSNSSEVSLVYNNCFSKGCKSPILRSTSFSTALNCAFLLSNNC